MHGHMKIHLQRLRGSYDQPGSVNTDITVDGVVNSEDEVIRLKQWANEALAMEDGQPEPPGKPAKTNVTLE